MPEKKGYFTDTPRFVTQPVLQKDAPRTVIHMEPMWIATICQDLTQGKSLQLLAETRQDCASRLHPLEPHHNIDLLAFEAFEDWRSQSFHIRRCNSSSARVVTKRLRLDDG